MIHDLKPFWRYYGGKYRAAPKYPAPMFGTIIEPFAGAAGYATRYYDRNVILYDKNPVIAGIWDYLIKVSSDEILRIPCVEAVADLPGWVPQAGRDLVGFWLNSGTIGPCTVLSAGMKRMLATGRKYVGWTVHVRDRIASQVTKIKHWKSYEMDYPYILDQEATWFVDPPYNNKAGSCYPKQVGDYLHLADWCRTRTGQVIVCENEGANWLPFSSFGTFKAGICANGNTAGSREVIWTNQCP